MWNVSKQQLTFQAKVTAALFGTFCSRGKNKKLVWLTFVGLPKFYFSRNWTKRATKRGKMVFKCFLATTTLVKGSVILAKESQQLDGWSVFLDAIQFHFRPSSTSNDSSFIQVFFVSLGSCLSVGVGVGLSVGVGVGVSLKELLHILKSGQQWHLMSRY